MPLFSELQPAMGTCLSCMKESSDGTPFGARRHRMNLKHNHNLHPLEISQEEEKELGESNLTKPGDEETKIPDELAARRQALGPPNPRRAVEEIFGLAEKDASWTFLGKIESTVKNKLDSLQGKGLLSYLFTLYKGVVSEEQSTFLNAKVLLDCVLETAGKLIIVPESYYAAENMHVGSLTEAQPYRDCLETMRLADSSDFFSDLIAKYYWDSKKEAIVRQLYAPCLIAISKLESEADPWEWSNLLTTVLAMIQSRVGAKFFIDAELRSLDFPVNQLERATILGNILRFPLASKFETKASRNSEPKKESAELPLAVKEVADLTAEIVKRLCEEHFTAVLEWFRVIASRNASEKGKKDSSSADFLLNAFLMLLSFCSNATLDFANYSSLVEGLKPEFCSRVLNEHEDLMTQFKVETQTFFLAHFYMNLFFDRLTIAVGPILSEQTYSHCASLFSLNRQLQLYNFITFTSFLLMNRISPANPIEKYLTTEFPASAPKAFSELPGYLIENLHNCITLYLKNASSEFTALNKGKLVPFTARLYLVLLYTCATRILAESSTSSLACSPTTSGSRTKSVRHPCWKVTSYFPLSCYVS